VCGLNVQGPPAGAFGWAWACGFLRLLTHYTPANLLPAPLFSPLPPGRALQAVFQTASDDYFAKLSTLCFKGHLLP
jgi:hypothetical protein